MTRKTWLAIAMSSVGALVATTSLFVWTRQTPAEIGDPDDSVQVAQGKVVYEQNCAACHGAQLEGQPNWQSRKPDGRLPAPPHDASGHTWHHPDQDLFRIVKFGVRPPLAPEGYLSDMPAFERVLTDGEISAVMAFIKSNWPGTIREKQRQGTEEKARR